MSSSTDTVPVDASVVPEVAPVNDAPAPPVSGDGEPSPKKAKVEEPSEPVKKRGRSSGGLSVAERTRREAEALIKDLKDTPDGGRRTRSATRGTPAPSPVTPKATRKPRESTPAVKSTAPAEKKPSSGRGRGRPPTKKVAAAKVEETNSDAVDANNGTETTSSDDPSATTTTNATDSEPAPNENGIGSESHEKPSAAPKSDSKPSADEEKDASGEKSKESEAPSPSDPWAAEAAGESKPSEVSEPTPIKAE